MSDEPKEKGTLERLVPVILDTVRIVELEMGKISDELLKKEQTKDD